MTAGGAVPSANGDKLSESMTTFLRAIDILTCADQFHNLVLLAFLFCLVNTTILWLVKCCCISKSKRTCFSKTNCCLKGGLLVFGFLIWLLSILLWFLLTLEWWGFTPWNKFMKLKQPARNEIKLLDNMFQAQDAAGNTAANAATDAAKDEWNKHADHDNTFLQFMARMFNAFQGSIVAAAKSANDHEFWIATIGHRASSEQWLRALVFYLGMVGTLQVSWLLEIIFIFCLVIWGDRESKADRKKREAEEARKNGGGKDCEKGEDQEALMVKGGNGGNFQYA